MQRHAIAPRAHWQQRMEAIGFDYHSIDGNYWQDHAYYRFSLAQIEQIEDATEELHGMCLQAVEALVRRGDYQHFALHPRLVPLVEQSWRAQEPSLYGRFDFCYDGVHPPKLLEYNADTPTGLLEASVAQWYWMQEQAASGLLPGADQFNSIHEALLDRWRAIARDARISAPVHFTTVSANREDAITLRYLQDVATQAGIGTRDISIEDIGLQAGRFVDQANRTMAWVFKLYPWEWLAADPFGEYLQRAPTRWIEPAWKALLSNKALLPLLWEMFPRHPYLLAAFHDRRKLPDPSRYVQKPLYSREGENVTLVDGATMVCSAGGYGREGFVYQDLCVLPAFTRADGAPVHACVGSWVVGNTACGIGVRDDVSPITQDTSLFVPHVFF